MHVRSDIILALSCEQSSVTRGNACRLFVARRVWRRATCWWCCRGSLTWGGKHRITTRASSSRPAPGLIVHLYRASAFLAIIPDLGARFAVKRYFDKTATAYQHCTRKFQGPCRVLDSEAGAKFTLGAGKKCCISLPLSVARNRRAADRREAHPFTGRRVCSQLTYPVSSCLCSRSLSSGINNASKPRAGRSIG